MEQIIQFYVSELRNNKTLSDETRARYQDIIDQYANAILSTMG